MEQITIDKLKLLEATHPKNTKNTKKLKVYYGWAKINKVQKKEALMVVFENEMHAGSETSRSGKTLRKSMKICHERYQSQLEQGDAQGEIRCFTVYNIFIQDKEIKGSLRSALQVNFDADKNHVDEAERKIIWKKLEDAFQQAHPTYKEPALP